MDEHNQKNNQVQENPIKETSANGAGNVDQIRDILFGSQMKEYERKFSRLEDRILKEVSSLKEDTNKRLDTLQGFVNTEVELLNNKVIAEKESRDDAIKSLVTELTTTAMAIEKKVGLLGNSAEKDMRELRQLLLEQSKTLSNEIDDKHREGMNIVDRSITELRGDKLDRNALSGLLTDVAIRLADNSHYSSTDD